MLVAARRQVLSLGSTDEVQASAPRKAQNNKDVDISDSDGGDPCQDPLGKLRSVVDVVSAFIHVDHDSLVSVLGPRRYFKYSLV